MPISLQSAVPRTTNIWSRSSSSHQRRPEKSAKSVNPMLLDSFLENSAALYPDKVALICGDRRATYAEINGGANALAHAFRSLGLARQDRVAVYYDNSVETVV